MRDWHDIAESDAPSRVGAAHGDPLVPTGAIGSRAHVRLTLDRVRGAVAQSPERQAGGPAIISWAEALVGVPERVPERVLQESLALRAQLRASVTAYVRTLRADGTAPERMLILVKSAVREATAEELAPLEGRQLMEDVVRWSVEAYYHAG